MEVFIMKRDGEVLDVFGSPDLAKLALSKRAEVIRVERMIIDYDADGWGFTVTHPLEHEWAAAGMPWRPAKYRCDRHQVVE